MVATIATHFEKDQYSTFVEWINMTIEKNTVSAGFERSWFTA